MQDFTPIIYYVLDILGSNLFILVASAIALAIKGTIFFALAKNYARKEKLPAHILYLGILLIASMVIEISWITKLVQLCFIPTLNDNILRFLIRIAWACPVIQYQALSVFIGYLSDKNYTINFIQKFFLLISSLFIFFFIGFAFVDFDYSDSVYENLVQKSELFYTIFLLIPFAIYTAIRALQKEKIPVIIKKQLNILVKFLIIPHWITEFINSYPINHSFAKLTSNPAFNSISGLLLAFALLFCARKIMGLRFLNIEEQKNDSLKISFMDDFKSALARLNEATNLTEICHISATFFQDTFSIPIQKTHVYIRSLAERDNLKDTPTTTQAITESFINTHEQMFESYMKRHKIMIYDEIDFTHFYHEAEHHHVILHFLDTINSDVFIPVFNQSKLVAYIVVEQDARKEQLYSAIEQDQMIIYSTFLGNIINLLENKNFDALIAQQEKIKHSLYEKHQEINQYKESIKTFLRNASHNLVGIIFYKNRSFTFGNAYAQETVKINLNTQKGHPITLALTEIVRKVLAYKSTQTVEIRDTQGNILIATAVAHLDQNSVIITISQPTISDIIKPQMDLLKDSTEFDFILYLQTTKSGKLINQLIPGNGPTLLNFKVDLLQAALSKKALLLDMPEDDIVQIVEILHHISLRDELHTFHLKGASDSADIAMTIFGINPIFDVEKKYTQPLLEKLNQTGTLFIKNIDFMNIETQLLLADFIQYGVYRMCKSNQKKQSDVRIICSTSKNFKTLLTENKIAPELMAQLKETVINMPALDLLPDSELYNLADNLTLQNIPNEEFHTILSLSEKEKNKLTKNRASSLEELKKQIKEIIKQKSKKTILHEETTFDPAIEDYSDPFLIEAARMGKQALKNEAVMRKLWEKFQNQNKIAQLLGVNRSSVQRRCKEYDIISE